MNEWLENNDILIYSTYNKRKSVNDERFIKTSVYKKMTANDIKSSHSSLNRLVDQ